MPINPPKKETTSGKTVKSIRNLDPLSLITGWVLCGLTIAFLALIVGVR